MAKKPPTSSQMEAVHRLMAGKEERSIAEKFADPNRPTWDQYKQENKDKLKPAIMNEHTTEKYTNEQ